MSTISVRLPDSLHQMAKAIATEDHISMNQFIASAVAEKISAINVDRNTATNEKRRRKSPWGMGWETPMKTAVVTLVKPITANTVR